MSDIIPGCRERTNFITTEYYAIFTLVFYIRILLQYAFYSHPYRHVNTLEYAAFHAVSSAQLNYTQPHSTQLNSTRPNS